MTAVSASMRKSDLLHFASHAKFDPERPEQSRLVLAPDGEASDGLTARTISGMRLGGVRLAVLSSCESTRSGIADAPVTIGLAKAFHDAGVPAVVGALWRVDDEATAALMTEFHRQYSRTRDAARALRDAQLALLRDARPARRDPAAWGAFVFTGR
jgi:CHAT domain-containing protein